MALLTNEKCKAGARVKSLQDFPGLGGGYAGREGTVKRGIGRQGEEVLWDYFYVLFDGERFPISFNVLHFFELIKESPNGWERTFILHWRHGKAQEVKGSGETQLKALANACNNAGIGGGALAALDYWEEKS